MERRAAHHYAPAEDATTFSFANIVRVSYDEDLCLRWCMDVGLLERTLLCPACHEPMRLYLGSKRWRCTKRKVHDDRKQRELTVYANSFFYNMKLTAGEAVRLLYAWSMRFSQAKAGEMAGVGPSAVSDWYKYCRSVCSQELVSRSCQIGGEGHVVEIDETSLAKKRKYNRGRVYQDYWLFGGVDRTTGQWFGRIVFDKRTKATLLPVIKEFVRPGSTIMSDMYASYVCERGGKLHTLENNRYLASMKYTHKWVNHSLNFVDPVSGAHTNTIEGLWEVHIKRHIKCMRGMQKKDLDAYIDEYMWRSWFFPPKATGAEYMNGLVQAIIRQER